MASSAPAPTLLEKLPARPPTPPRETHHPEPSDVLLKSLPARLSPFKPRPSLHTPPNANSPSSTAPANSTNPGSARMGKRVGWSAQTEYREPPNYQNGDRLQKSSPLSAPSSASSKPLKGILKPSSSPNPLSSSLSHQLDGTGATINITEMLDSTIKQLAGSDRDSKLDAYMMLTRALKASNNLPDRVALQDKMSLLMQFIQRDVTSKNENGTLDSSLVNHSLTLLTTFLHFPAIASTITSDFALFIIDQSIRTFEDPSMPKDVVRHFMQVVAFQNFSPKVMSADRVGRLVASLHRIEDHLRGKSIVMSRIHIYKKLVDKSRNHMAIHTDWIKDMLTDMLSSIKEIRAQAINLGMEAGFSYRPGNQMMRKVADILQTSNDEQTYTDFYIQRLGEMVKDKQRSAAVPQIWSVVTLFLRCPLDRWEHYNPWLSLIQAAFNSSDGLTKQEANYAWNRYVFLSLMDNRPTSKLLSVLCQPLMSQLRRKPSARQPEESKRLRGTVIKGIYNLYYYAFRPGSERTSPPEVAWDIAVQPVISQLLGLDGSREAQPDDIIQASKILVGLLDVSTPFIWNEDRIRDLPPVQAEELPSIESKWIRKNSERVFKGLGPIMDKKFTDLANKESLTYRLWQAIVGSVAAASVKDIKVSEDTARFFACTLGLLSQIWTKGCPDNDELLRSKFYPSVRNMIRVLVDSLGLLPFTEKKLSMTVSHTFEPVATPSHRPDRSEKPRGVVRNSLQHLFTMLSSVPQGGSDDDAFSEFFQSAFEPFCVGKSDKVRLELTRDLLRLLPQNTLSPFALWDLGAQAVHLSLSASVPQSSSSDGKLRGPELREVVSFLERGLTSHPNLPAKSWLALFEALCNGVTAEFGDAGRAIVVIEPLAKVLVDELRPSSAHLSTRTLAAARAVFSAAKFPRDRQALDAAKRKIWGTPATIPKAGSSDPFDSLYKLGNITLSCCYQQLPEIDPSVTIAPFVESLGTFVLDALASTGLQSLPKLQDGLSLWLQDEKAQLKLNNDSLLCNSIRELWTKICAELKITGHLHKAQFDQVEGILMAAFKSKHRFIVNVAAETWNAIIKDDENPDCSDSLKSVVSSLRSRVDVVVPGVEESSGEFGAQATSFLDSQEEVDSVPLSTGASHQASASIPAPAPVPVVSSQGSASRRRRLQVTPEAAKVTPSTRVTRSARASTPRLRHDNSQIQFEPVASSSPAAGESQHLTERQMETRERQKQTAALYSDVQAASPSAMKDVSGDQAKATATNSDARREATPDRPASYSELISSTPTPRRGQVIPMDGDNDLPSSPPEPRPYPLLSEIRSRSRHSSIENWDFSSPPCSPVTSRQQVVQDAEPLHVALTDDSTQAKAPSQSTKRKTRSSQKDASPDVVRSSLPETPSRDVHSAKIRHPLPEVPRTPRRNGPPATTSETTPKSGEEEFMDARSSPERSSPALPDLSAHGTTSNASFAFSEGDESQFVKLAAELDAEKPQKAEVVMDSITVQADASSPAKSAEDSEQEESARDLIPSTPAEPVQDDTEGSRASRKRKRKRGTRNPESRRKKKRSSESPSSSPAEMDKSRCAERSSSSVPAGQGSITSPEHGIKRRRSARMQKKQEAAEGRDVSEAEHDDSNERDTDEEVLSQLMTESNGASQARDSPVGDVAVAQSTIEDSMDVDSTRESVREIEAVEEEEHPAAPEGGQETTSTADSIMERLRGGLEGLRNASLSRAEVYQIEDMLMDMKRELFEAERRGRRSE